MDSDENSNDLSDLSQSSVDGTATIDQLLGLLQNGELVSSREDLKISDSVLELESLPIMFDCDGSLKDLNILVDNPNMLCDNDCENIIPDDLLEVHNEDCIDNDQLFCDKQLPDEDCLILSNEFEKPKRSERAKPDDLSEVRNEDCIDNDQLSCDKQLPDEDCPILSNEFEKPKETNDQNRMNGPDPEQKRIAFMERLTLASAEHIKKMPT